MYTNVIYNTDALSGLKKLPDESIDCIVTSPPYWQLRDYGHKDQLGLEKTFYEYIDKLVEIMDQCKRVLKSSGSLWLNLGDTYSTQSGQSLGKSYPLETSKVNNTEMGSLLDKSGSGLPSKCLCMIPERISIKMLEYGWILRNEVIWHKPNPMPCSMKDRMTVNHEKMYFFVKNQKYYYKQLLEPLKSKKPTNIKFGGNNYKEYGNSTYSGNIYDPSNLEGKNKRTVWTISTKGCKEAHFATFPLELIDNCISASCPIGGIVLDPFMGSGTAAVSALQHDCNYIGFELNESYIEIINKRIEKAKKSVKKQLFSISGKPKHLNKKIIKEIL